MANPGKAQYKQVLEFIYGQLNAKNNYQANWKLICVGFDMELGIRNESKIYGAVQNMCYLKWLVPVQCGVGIVDRIYEIGEEGLKLIHEKDLVVV